MSKSDEIRRDQRLAEEARPLILRRLREAAEPAAIAREVASEFSVEATKAYRWVAYIAEDFEKRRRRIAAVGLALLWVGAIALAGGPLLTLLGVGPSAPLWLYGIVVGAPLAAAGGWTALRSRRLVRDTV